MALLFNGLATHLIMMSLIFSSNANENRHCSKFPYEEALLDKMVRMEIKVEQMEKRILATKDLILHEMDDLKENKVKIDEHSKKLAEDIKHLEEKAKEDLKEFKDNLNTEISEKSGRMESIFQQREATLNRMTAELMSLKNTTQVLVQSAARPPPIYFMAKVTQKLSYVKNDVMLFDTILHKEGDHYDPTNGKFTAPLDGIYLFMVQMCFPSSHGIEFGFAVDGEIEQVGWSYDASSDTCESSLFIKNLRANSRVWVQNTHSNRLREDKYYRWNIFSGALISFS